LLPSDEVDLHFGRREWGVEYQDVMADIDRLVREKVREAQESGRPYLMFIHGWSTSRPGQTTARSIVRGFMRSKDATSFIVKAGCIQHETVFIAKIRPVADRTVTVQVEKAPIKDRDVTIKVG
jgi:hypothetical protein